MRSTMMFMSATALAACLTYKPAVAAEATSAEPAVVRQASLDSAAAGAAVAQPAVVKTTEKRALKPISKRLVARIDLSSQTMSVEVDGETQHSWKISSGAANGYHTPTGSYTPFHMTKLHRSRKYDNAPMPNAVFFRGGFAIHATGATWALGRPASHGCVRLSPTNAKTFYSLVQKYSLEGTTVRISGATPVKTSLSAAPAGSSSRKATRQASNWQGFDYSYSGSSYVNGNSKRSYYYGSSYGNSRVSIKRQGRRITQTWW